nr:FAD-dependent oxidoreductase [Actinomadura madurae]
MASPARVAVIGSGPAGIYAAEALVKQTDGDVRVDVFDRLPTPYGLVRYGVAPDHKSIKSIARYLQRVLENPGVRFFGCVELGRDLTRADLLDCYDAVIYSTGAMVDRHMRIPGEDLPGSIAATDFVNWYCGHPDAADHEFDLSVEEVAVIGVGNVAVDVVRILAKTARRAARDRRPRAGHRGAVAEPGQARAHDRAARAGAGEVHHQGGPRARRAAERDHPRRPRRHGPRPGERRAGRERPARPRQHQGPERLDGRAAAGRPRHIDVRFWRAPAEILGTDRVEGLRLERTRLDESGRVTGTGEFETLPVGMVLRSVGYQSVPLEGVPFDERSFVVPNEGGRITGPDGAPVPREYVAGWIKRGPTGVVGTNKSDAAETVRNLLDDLAGTETAPKHTIEELLESRGLRVVTYDDWLKLDAAEIALGESLDRGERVKLARWEAMTSACRGE